MLITGATGFIGSQLAKLALDRGYSVRTLTRRDWQGSPAVPRDQRYFGNLPHEIPVSALQGVDVVVHCAAIAEANDESSISVNLEGTIQLADQARRQGAPTFIFLSSQSARADALSSYGQTKYAAEQALMEMSGLNVIILRPGLVVGPGKRGLFSRMSRMVETYPIIPLLAGGKSIVQPIHVDELCEAIFQCDVRAPEIEKRIFKLGHPDGIRLADFLQSIALSRCGKRRLMVPIPIQPVEIALRVTEAMGVQLPINSSNLKGLRLVEKMKTADDLSYLNLGLRPLDEMVRDNPTDIQQPLGDPVRVLLVGAGRIGLVHALTLSRLEGLVLSGVIDPNSGARSFLRKLGISAPMYPSLDQALAEARADAVVIATPPVTHFSLARACIERSLPVMIEKPLAIQQTQLEQYERLQKEFPSAQIQVGYVMTRNPQVSKLLAALHSGRFGSVRGFAGVTLLSFIQEKNSKRWEVDKTKSGGGVLINSGGHVLSMIHAAFGTPQSIEGQTLSLYSNVEDSMVLNFTYPDFKGIHYCSWSINGYPRQENKLIIWTDGGRLILTGSVGVFVSNSGEVEVTHQLDFDLGFNLAPDYAGGGFSNELKDLKNTSLSGLRAPMDLSTAVAIEKVLFSAYDNSRSCQQFEKIDADDTFLPQAVRLSPSIEDSFAPTGKLRRILDLRQLSSDDVATYFIQPSASWNEYLVVPEQFAKVPAALTAADRVHVTVPDFLNQTRLISAGRHREVVRQMGFGGIATALRAAMPLLIRERSPSFWVAAMGLLAAAIHELPKDFSGTMLLHVYLTDLAFALKRFDMLDRMLGTCRRLRPRARVGFHTNISREAIENLRLMSEPVDSVSALTSPDAIGMSEIFAQLRAADRHKKLRLTAEVGLAPDIVHRVAFHHPERWAHSADGLLIGIGADASLAEKHQATFRKEWDSAFPGVRPPEGTL